MLQRLGHRQVSTLGYQQAQNPTRSSKDQQRQSGYQVVLECEGVAEWINYGGVVQGVLQARWRPRSYSHSRQFQSPGNTARGDRSPSTQCGSCLFPPNATSVFQPLDQGVIRTMKANYKRHWMTFVAEKYSNDENSLKEVDIRIALRWLVDAWHE